MEFIPKNQILEFNSDTLTTVRSYYNLDQSRMYESINILQEWVKKQPHLIKKDFPRNYLETVIITSKGSIEKAKKQIDKICTFKTLLPKFFMKYDIKSDLAEITQTAAFVPLPKMTKDYLRVYIVQLKEKELNSTDLIKYYRFNIVLCEYLKAYDYTNGYVVIDDFRKMNLADMITKVNLVELQQYVSILTEGFGARMLGIHILTESKVIDTFIKTVSQFLPPKVCSRIHVHDNLDSLHQILDKEILPIEYGGKERSMNELSDKWLAVLSTDECKEYMKDVLAARTDETRRTVDKFNNEYLGLPGSIRNLNVD